MSTRLTALQINPNYTLGRGEDAVLTHVRGLADLNGRQCRAPVRSNEPLGSSFPFVPHDIRNSGFRRRGSWRPREQEIHQFPKAINSQLSLSCVVARAHQMRRHRPDQFAAQGERSRAKEHWRAPAGEFPKSRGAAAIFSICQKDGPFDQHMALTSDIQRRPPRPSPRRQRRVSCGGAASSARARACSA